MCMLCSLSANKQSWKGTNEKMKKELTVYFFKDTENLHCKYNPLTPEVIMKIVQNNWKIEGEHEKYAPKFVSC